MTNNKKPTKPQPRFQILQTGDPPDFTLELLEDLQVWAVMVKGMAELYQLLDYLGPNDFERLTRLYNYGLNVLTTKVVEMLDKNSIEALVVPQPEKLAVFRRKRRTNLEQRLRDLGPDVMVAILAGLINTLSSESKKSPEYFRSGIALNIQDVDELITAFTVMVENIREEVFFHAP